MLVSLTIHFMFTSSNLIFLGPQVVAAVAFFKFISGLLLEQSQVSDGENNDATQKKQSTHKRSKKSPHSPPTLIDVPLYFDDDLSSSHNWFEQLFGWSDVWDCVQETRDAHTIRDTVRVVLNFFSFFFRFSFITSHFTQNSLRVEIEVQLDCLFFCFFAFFLFHYDATGPFSSQVAPVCEVCSEKQTIFWLWHPAQWLGLPGSSSFQLQFFTFLFKSLLYSAGALTWGNWSEENPHKDRKNLPMDEIFSFFIFWSVQSDLH